MFDSDKGVRDVLRRAARSFAPFQWWAAWYATQEASVRTEEMLMWVYREMVQKPNFWEVGFFDPSGDWHRDGCYDEQAKAAARCRWLNGGDCE